MTQTLDLLPDNYVEALPGRTPDQVLLDQLRGEITWSNDDVAKTENAFNVARVFGDRALNAADGTGASNELLRLTRLYNTPTATTYGSETVRGGSAYYAEGVNHLHVTPEGVERAAVRFRQEAEARGIEWRHPGDPDLFATLLLVGHEAGHAILGGASQFIRFKKGLTEGAATAVRAYMARHPEQGFTGHWRSDYNIFGEQFSEGYAHLSLKTAMAAAGYAPTEIKKLMEGAKIPNDVSGEHGANQIDHLHHEQYDQSPAERTNGSVHQQETGMFGYAKPLNQKELVKAMQELHAIIRGPEASISLDQDAATWASAVRKNQSRAVRSHLKHVTEQRLRHLNPEKAKVKDFWRNVRLVGAMVVAGVAVGTGAVLIANEHRSPMVVESPSHDAPAKFGESKLTVVTDAELDEYLKQHPEITDPRITPSPAQSNHPGTSPTLS